jgi:hypothetical protein
MGNTDLKKIDSGIIPADQRGITKAGKVCGIAGTFLMPCVILAGILISVLIAVSL